MSSTSSGEAPPPSKLIPAGTFDFLNEQTQKTTPATLSHDFYLDELEVTVARFKAWIDGGQKPPCASGTCTLDPGGPYETTMIWDSAWNLSSASQSFQDPASCGNAGSNTGPSDNHAPTWGLPDGATFPIGCLNWYQAVAFCASEGKRLPTETEWQYAASGRGLGRTYPWGNTEPVGCTQAIWNNGAAAPGFNGCGFPKVVGSVLAGASRDGVLDMAGSLYEWLWDFDGAYPDAATLDYPRACSGRLPQHARRGLVVRRGPDALDVPRREQPGRRRGRQGPTLREDEAALRLRAPPALPKGVSPLPETTPRRGAVARARRANRRERAMQDLFMDQGN
jgi:formylglycine-generating enzyme required for sulfatase activity